MSFIESVIVLYLFLCGYSILRLFCGRDRIFRSLAAALPVGCYLYAATVFVSSQIVWLPVNLWGLNFIAIFGALSVWVLSCYGVSFRRCRLAGSEIVSVVLAAILALLLYGIFSWLNMSLTTGDSLQSMHAQFGFDMIRGDRMFNRTLAGLAALVGVDRQLFALLPLGGVSMLLLAGEMIWHEVAESSKTKATAWLTAIAGSLFIALTHMTQINFFYINNHMWAAVIVLLSVSILLDVDTPIIGSDSSERWRLVGGCFFASLLGIVRLDGPLFGLLIAAVTLGRVNVEHDVRRTGALSYAIASTPLLVYMIWLDSGKVSGAQFLLILFATWLFALFFSFRLPRIFRWLHQYTGMFLLCAALLAFSFLLFMNPERYVVYLQNFIINTFEIRVWGYSWHYLVVATIAILAVSPFVRRMQEDRFSNRLQALGILFLGSLMVIFLLTPFQNVRLGWSNSHNRMLFHFFPLVVIWVMAQLGLMFQFQELRMQRIASALKRIASHHGLLGALCGIAFAAITLWAIFAGYSEVLVLEAQTVFEGGIHLPTSFAGISLASLDSVVQRIWLRMSDAMVVVFLHACTMGLLTALMVWGYWQSLSRSSSMEKMASCFLVVPLFWVIHHNTLLSIGSYMYLSFGIVLFVLANMCLLIVHAKRREYSLSRKVLAIVFAGLTLGGAVPLLAHGGHAAFVFSACAFIFVTYGLLRLKDSARFKSGGYVFMSLAGILGYFLSSQFGMGISPRLAFVLLVLFLPLLFWFFCILYVKCTNYFLSSDLRGSSMFLFVTTLVTFIAIFLTWRTMRLPFDQDAWQLEQLRQRVGSQIETPATFYVVDRPSRQIFDRMYADVPNVVVTNLVKEMWGSQQKEEKGIDKAFKASAAHVNQLVRENAIYTYGAKSTAEKFWLDRVPLFTLGDFSREMLPLGRKLDGGIYRLQNWSNVVRQVSVPEAPHGMPLLMGVDMGRVWDDLGRSDIAVKFGDDVLPMSITNHFQWVSFKLEDEVNILHIASDAPLPADPHVQFHQLNDPVRIKLGDGGDYWYRNYMSESLFPMSMHDVNYAMLFGEGSIEVPVFADTSHETFARLYIQYWDNEVTQQYDGRHWLTISVTDTHNKKVAMPAAHETAEVTIRLANGSGELDLFKLNLTTTLPSLEEQEQALADRSISRFSFVALYDVTILSLPRYLPARYSLSADVLYDPWIAGSYPVETVEDLAFRWLQPDATISLPAASEEGCYNMILHTLNNRPADQPAETKWFWGGEEVDAVKVETDAEKGIISYHFENVYFSGFDTNTFRIQSQEWVPTRDSDIPDRRSLGISFVGMDIQP